MGVWSLMPGVKMSLSRPTFDASADPSGIAMRILLAFGSKSLIYIKRQPRCR
jgi:hypothetical protein